MAVWNARNRTSLVPFKFSQLASFIGQKIKSIKPNGKQSLSTSFGASKSDAELEF